MSNEKHNVIEFLILDDNEFVITAIKKIYHREPSQSEIDEYLYNLRTGQSNKINLLRLLTKSSEGIKNSPNVKGLFLFSALNRAIKFPLIGILFKPLFYLIHIPVLMNQTAFIKDKLHGLGSVLSDLNSDFAENKQKLFDLYLHIGRISRYNKRLENVIEKDINEIHKNREQLTSLLETHIERSGQDLFSMSQEIKARIDQLDKLSNNNLEQFDKCKNQLKTLSQNFQTLSQRSEFIREELLYEFKYSGKTDKQTGQIQIVNKRKYQQRKKDIKINVGCGHLPLRGYLNIDKRKLPNVDIVTDALNLPFEKESISELYSAHLIEHFPEEEFKRSVLPYWYSLIKKGGILKLIFPDFDTMAQKYTGKDFSFQKFRKVIFGAQDYNGDFHYNLFTKETLTILLFDVGFREVNVPVVGRLNGDCYEMAFVAKK